MSSAFFATLACTPEPTALDDAAVVEASGSGAEHSASTGVHDASSTDEGGAANVSTSTSEADLTGTDGAHGDTEDAPPEPPATPARARPLPELAFPASHNSYNYAPVFQLPNVNDPVAVQLEAGIRGFELDVHEQDGELRLFHNAGGVLGSEPAADVVADIVAFLHANPEQIVFLKFEAHVDASAIASLLVQTEAEPLVYRLDAQSPMPTVGEVIDDGRRLFVTGIGAGVGSGLRQCATQWGVTSPDDLWPPESVPPDCANDFLVVIAYVLTDLIGTGSPADAAVVNDPEYLVSLAERAWKINGKRVSRLVVDFPDVGDVVAATETLNRWYQLSGVVRHDGEPLAHVDWTCTYSFGQQTVEARTEGRFNFPAKPFETVTVTPHAAGYTFDPPHVEWADVEADRVVEFVASVDE